MPLVNRSLALHRVAQHSRGHTGGQRMALHEQKHKAESWKEGLDLQPGPSAAVLHGLHSPASFYSAWAPQTLSAPYMLLLPFLLPIQEE